MAHFKVFAAIFVALSAIALEAEALKLDGLRKHLTDSLSPEDLADAEKAFSVAKQYIIDNKKSDAQLADELLPAWERVIEKPDQCDELSLGYIATIANTWPQIWIPMRSLAEANQKYASRCLTPGYIKERIDIALERFKETLRQKELPRKTSLKSKIAAKRRDLVFKISKLKKLEIKDVDEIQRRLIILDSLEWRASDSFETEFKFIDDQFIDYSSAHPENNIFDEMKKNPRGDKTRFVVNAMIRELKENVKGMSVDDDRYAYLYKSLFRPCYNYRDALRKVIRQIRTSSLFLEGGSEKLIASLDKNTQRVFSRDEFCVLIETAGGVDNMDRRAKFLLKKMHLI